MNIPKRNWKPVVINTLDSKLAPTLGYNEGATEKALNISNVYVCSWNLAFSSQAMS